MLIQAEERRSVRPWTAAAAQVWSKHIDASNLRYFAGEVLEAGRSARHVTTIHMLNPFWTVLATSRSAFKMLISWVIWHHVTW